MHFATLPDDRFAQNPSGLAISDSCRSLTNADLLSRTRAAAEQLQELGVGRGDVIALRLTNRIEFVVLLFAAWRLGAAATPVNPALTDIEVGHQLLDSGARLLVIEEGTEPATSVASLSVAHLRETSAGPETEGPS